MARITVKVHPRARRTAVAGRFGDAWKLDLAAPPVDGKANQECMRFLAELAGVPQGTSAHRRRRPRAHKAGGSGRHRAGRIREAVDRVDWIPLWTSPKFSRRFATRSWTGGCSSITIMRDPLAYRVLGFTPPRTPTRRWYYLIPAEGEPRGLEHRIERNMIGALPGEKIPYSSWTEQVDGAAPAHCADCSAWPCSIRRFAPSLTSRWWTPARWNWCAAWAWKWSARPS